VRLLYDAFPYQRFGSFTGRIARVSRTAMDPRELNVPLKIEEPVYRIEVTPGAQTVEAYGESLPLQPGMSLTASLILERRSFLDWLLTPLRAVKNRT
jgi:membrane fusion protein